MRLPRRIAPRNDGSDRILEIIVECKLFDPLINKIPKGKKVKAFRSESATYQAEIIHHFKTIGFLF